MDLNKIIALQKQKFEKGKNLLQENKSEWSGFVSRVTEIFEDIINEGKEQKIFERLYVFDSLKNKEHNSSLHTISLLWGQHPTGTEKFKIDDGLNITDKELIIEKGGTLVFSQLPTGGIAILIYPMDSEVFKRNEEYIIADTYKSPNDVTVNKIYRAINDFFAYSQCSSIFGSPNLIDWTRVSWLLFRDIRNRKKAVVFLVKHTYEVIRTLVPLLIGIMLGVFTMQ